MLYLWSFFLWGQSLYPPNPYQDIFDQVYQMYPSLPRGILEAVSFTQTRFYWVDTTTPASCVGIPRGWGFFDLKSYDPTGFFRPNLLTIAQLSGIPPQKIQSDPLSQAQAYAQAYLNLCQLRQKDPQNLQENADLFLALSYLPAPTSAQWDLTQDFAQASELYEIYRFLCDPQASTLYHFPKRNLDLYKIFGPNLKVLSARQVMIDDSGIHTLEGESYMPFARTENADYSGAIWNPTTCNYSSRNGTPITHVTLHTTQGSYAGTISWFKNCSSNVSAHYVIRSSDGQITQMVREADKAWHVGSENSYTIGIEHEGYINNPSYYTQAMYAASAALVKDICNRRGISPRSTWFGDACSGSTSSCLTKSCIQIKGHQQYPNQTHTDPGPYWNWNYYYQLINDPYTINQTFTTPTGTIYDPGGANNPYNASQRYFIKIAPPGATSLTLNFTQLDLEDNFTNTNGRGGDYLYIYEGETTHSPLLYRLTGSTLPPSITVGSGKVLLELRSDCSNQNAGWTVQYTALTSNGNPSDSTPPTTQISQPPDWVTQNFPLTFTDNDNVGVEKAFYLVMYDSLGDWRANPERGFFSDNFVTLHPSWQTASGTWTIVNSGNGNTFLRQTDESVNNTNLYTYLKQDLSNRYLYHWAGRFAGGTSTNRRMGLHIFCDNPTLYDRGNSYFVFFRLEDQKVQLYKVTNNSWAPGPVAEVTYPFQDNTWYDFKWSYDRVTGDMHVYINNQLVLSWKDTNPISSGNYISLRTGNAIADYKNFKVYRSRVINGTVTIRVGDSLRSDIRIQSSAPTHYAARIRSIVQDSAGNLSASVNQDVKVDWTPPTAPAWVWDCEQPTCQADEDITNQNTQLAARWGPSEDPHSGIIQYEYSIGTSPGGNDILSWNSTNANDFTHPLTLQPNVTYYVSVRAQNGAGLVSDVTSSNGISYSPSTSLFSPIPIFFVPTPTSSPITLHATLPNPIAFKLTIYDTHGREVYTATYHLEKGQYLLPLGYVGTGMYLLHIQTPEGKITQKVFVLP